MAPQTRPAGPALMCGEVRTCLLPTRDAVGARIAERLLQLRPDERVRLSRRPNLHALSPEVLTGVDCRLPTASGAKVRAIGTVAARAALTEGRVLQATAYFSAPATGPDRRRPWGYYLVRPGVLVPLGRLPREAVAQGFLDDPHAPELLDVGSVAEGLLARISRQHRLLDHDPPLRTSGTRLRWAALAAPAGTPAHLVSFTVDDEDSLRTAELRVPEDTAPDAVAGLCEDLALHDWLLTTVGHKLDGLPLGPANGAGALKTLGPLVEHLLHVWMPRARVDPALGPLWQTLEQRPGFTRQWQNLVQRLRDQMALRALLPRSDEALAAR
ncbi:SCO2521 family protein [Streptomyces sp. NK08204]|uniref:SCO2521 family protein n=1 Tax=Streptomyces sp. NK08204 TaxID=2873260 RepID=UPI001CEC02E0|nr:SCO2521 family protein [Streptomyces sp. NK08204]